MLEGIEQSTAKLARPESEQISLDKIMGLAVFGEKVAARTYALMANLRAEHKDVLQSFSTMEATHGTWFAEVSRENGIAPDKAFADNELSYLKAQVDDHYRAGDFDALAVVQGFIVESLAIATYDPMLAITDRYPGTRGAFEKALAEEHYHVDWITRYLRLRFFDATGEFVQLTRRVNVQGVDCVGGTMMNIADFLDEIGISGADCAGGMMDVYTKLLENVGLTQQDAIKDVVSLFMPVVRKYRHGQKTK